MGHLVAAPDKFRGTARASEVAAAAARAATACGWTCDEVPMADGGEGLLDAVGGEPQRARVTGPLGRSTEATWHLLPAGSGGPPTAVIEMAEASGRALVPHPTGTDPVAASTSGVGELVLAAVEAGAGSVVVGCGGSATTDGGWGAVEAIGDRRRLRTARLVVATDVTTPFTDAARVFGPQKGASPEQVSELTTRLEQLVERYRKRFGVDVSALPGAGAAGGLAGGLAALGARIVPGFDLVASIVGLSERVARADRVLTGEGHLDPPSLSGKVVGGVIATVGGRAPILCVVGDADPGTVRSLAGSVSVVRLAERAGARAARDRPIALVEEAVVEYLSGSPDLR